MLGDLDFPREWYDLDLYEKVSYPTPHFSLCHTRADSLTFASTASLQLEAINQVCDWHMQDSTRFRNHISYGDPDMEAGWVSNCCFPNACTLITN